MTFEFLELNQANTYAIQFLFLQWQKSILTINYILPNFLMNFGSLTNSLGPKLTNTLWESYGTYSHIKIIVYV